VERKKFAILSGGSPGAKTSRGKKNPPPRPVSLSRAKEKEHFRHEMPGAQKKKRRKCAPFIPMWKKDDLFTFGETQKNIERTRKKKPAPKVVCPISRRKKDEYDLQIAEHTEPRKRAEKEKPSRNVPT